MEPPVSPAVYVPTTAMGFIMDAANDVAIYQSAATMAHTDSYKLPNVRTTLPTWPKTNPRTMIKTMIGKFNILTKCNTYIVETTSKLYLMAYLRTFQTENERNLIPR